MARIEDITWAKEIPPTGLDLIGDFERQLGITFPDDYKEFAQQYAGGKPRSFSDFDFILEGRPFYASVGVFLAYQPAADVYTEEEDTDTVQWQYENVEFLPDKFVPITSGGGSDCTGFYFKYAPPKIAFWKFGLDDTEPVVIADSFTDFLAMLYDDPD